MGNVGKTLIFSCRPPRLYYMPAATLRAGVIDEWQEDYRPKIHGTLK